MVSQPKQETYIMVKRQWRTYSISAAIFIMLAAAGVLFMGFKQTSDNPNANQAKTSSNTGAGKPETVATPNQKPVQEKTETKEYTNKTYGFSFSYPKEWRVVEADIASTTQESDKVELSLRILSATHKDSPEIGALMVRGMNLQSTIEAKGPLLDPNNEYGVAQQLKGKDAIKYTIPQTESVDRLIYYFGVGDKTYSLQTFNEEINISRTPNYVAEFNKLYESLRLP